jgi:hypothetical protein
MDKPLFHIGCTRCPESFQSFTLSDDVQQLATDAGIPVVEGENNGGWSGPAMNAGYCALTMACSKGVGDLEVLVHATGQDTFHNGDKAWNGNLATIPRH